MTALSAALMGLVGLASVEPGLLAKRLDRHATTYFDLGRFNGSVLVAQNGTPVLRRGGSGDGQLTGVRLVSIVIITYLEGTPVATTVSAAKAKAEFAECMRKAEAGDPVVITRHGKAVVALVRADRLQQLERLGAAGPAAGLAGLVGGWRGSEELVKLLAGSRRTKARRVPRPGR